MSTIRAGGAAGDEGIERLLVAGITATARKRRARPCAGIVHREGNHLTQPPMRHCQAITISGQASLTGEAGIGTGSLTARCPLREHPAPAPSGVAHAWGGEA